jgi:hypothetical protein
MPDFVSADIADIPWFPSDLLTLNTALRKGQYRTRLAMSKLNPVQSQRYTSLRLFEIVANETTQLVLR